MKYHLTSVVKGKGLLDVRRMIVRMRVLAGGSHLAFQSTAASGRQCTTAQRLRNSLSLVGTGCLSVPRHTWSSYVVFTGYLVFSTFRLSFEFHLNSCPIPRNRGVYKVRGTLHADSSSMSTQVQGTLLDVLKKKMRQTKEEMEKYKDECEEYQKRLQVEVIRREEAESEVAALNRRIQLLEEDLERSEERLATATAKLAEASQAADESERIRKALENRTNMEDDRVSLLEQQLAQAKLIAEEADKKYEEVARKLVMMEQDLERAEEKAELSEGKIVELEEELRVVGNNLKSLEVSEEKATQREETFVGQVKILDSQLKEAEARAEFAERSVQKLQKEVDRLEDDLAAEREKNKLLQEEMEATLHDIQNM